MLQNVLIFLLISLFAGSMGFLIWKARQFPLTEGIRTDHRPSMEDEKGKSGTRPLFRCLAGLAAILFFFFAYMFAVSNSTQRDARPGIYFGVGVGIAMLGIALSGYWPRRQPMLPEGSSAATDWLSTYPSLKRVATGLALIYASLTITMVLVIGILFLMFLVPKQVVS